jgi:hypothetical protein
MHTHVCRLLHNPTINYVELHTYIHAYTRMQAPTQPDHYVEPWNKSQEQQRTARTHAPVSVYMRVCICMCTYVCEQQRTARTHAPVSVCMRVCVCVSMRACMYPHIHARTHTHTHTYQPHTHNEHTYIHIYIHTYTRTCSRLLTQRGLPHI